MLIEQIINEDGRIVQGVNTTDDVKTGETKRQAAKFGNKVSPDGVPPLMHSKLNKSTNTAFNLGLSESSDSDPLDIYTMTPEEIADKHGVPVGTIEKQLQKGVKVEMEHTTDRKVAREIALDHISEFADYYDRLKTIEK